jgi:peptide/nickel transport system substrate-binding protein
MFRRRRKLRLAGVAAVAASALIAAACSSSGSSNSSGGTAGTKVTGGTARIGLQAGITYSYIFPFYPITYAGVYNDNQFQWLMYRPLYMFGANNPTNVTINYPLSTADPPVYSNGGKTVAVTMKGWKWSDGSTVDAKSLIFFVNMAEAEKAI